MSDKILPEPGPFPRAADAIAVWAGSARALPSAVRVIVLWICLGPVCGYSESWQLSISTGTSIVTFLMVFLLQKTQNRDTLAVHLKLNELIAALEEASNHLINADEFADETMHRFYHRFRALAETIRDDDRTTCARSVEDVTHSDQDMVSVTLNSHGSGDLS